MKFLFFLMFIFFQINIVFAANNSNAHSAHADQLQSFSLKNVKVKSLSPGGWKNVQGFLGSDLSFLGSESQNGGSRTTLSIYDAEASLSRFPVEKALATKNDFFSGRKEWIISQGGQYLNDVSARQLKFENSNNTGLELSFDYQLDGQKFREYSYYVTCNGEFLFMKGLVPSNHIGKDEESKLKKIATSIQCEKPGSGLNQTSFSKDDLNTLFKKLKNKNSASLAVKHLRQFMLKHEASADVNPFIEEETSALLEKNDSSHYSLLIESLIPKFFKIPFLINQAVAESVYKTGGSCIFGGWVSTFTKKSNGKLTCQSPQTGAANYSSSSCSGSSFQCNPVIFGPGVCINKTDRDLNQVATLRCDAQRKSDQEIQKYVEAHPEELQDLVQNTNQLCTDQNYLKNNPELCGSLIQQLSDITGNEDGSEFSVQEADEAYQNFIRNKDIDPEDYEAASDVMQSQLKAFEQTCMTDSGSYKSGIVPVHNESGQQIATMDCVQERNNILNNLKKLKKIEDLSDLDEKPSAVCKPPANDLQKQSVKINDAMINLNCTLKKDNGSPINRCMQDVNCALVRSFIGVGQTISLIEKVSGKKMKIPGTGKNCTSDDDCLSNAATAVVKGLWGTLTSLGSLAKDAFVAGGTWLWNKVSNSNVENESSKRIQMMAKTTNSTLKEFWNDPAGFLSNMFKGILNGITEFMTDDVFCMEWQGVPRFSKCNKPLPSLGCMDCKTLIKGTCAAVGHVTEKLIETMSGAWFAGLGKGLVKGVSSNIANMLKKSAKAGKLKKIEANMLKAMPNVAKGLAAAKKGTVAVLKAGAKSVDIAKKSFVATGKGLKYLGGKSVSPLISKISNLKALPAAGSSVASGAVKNNFFSKVVMKSSDIKNSIVDMHKKAYQHGLATGLKLTDPKVGLKNMFAGNAASSAASQAIEPDKITQPPSRTPEEKAQAYKAAKMAGAQDIEWEDVPNSAHQKKLGSGSDRNTSSSAKVESTPDVEPMRPNYSDAEALKLKNLRSDIKQGQNEYDNTLDKIKTQRATGKNATANTLQETADLRLKKINEQRDELASLQQKGTKEAGVSGPVKGENQFRTMEQDLGKSPVKRKAFENFQDDFGGKLPDKINDLANDVHNTPTHLSTGLANPAKVEKLSILRNEMQQAFEKSGLSPKAAAQKAQERLKELKRTGVLGVNDGGPSSFSETYEKWKNAEGRAKLDLRLQLEDTKIYGRQFREAREKANQEWAITKEAEAQREAAERIKNTPTFEQAMDDYRNTTDGRKKLEIRLWLEKNHYNDFKNEIRKKAPL